MTPALPSSCSAEPLPSLSPSTLGAGGGGDDLTAAACAAAGAGELAMLEMDMGTHPCEGWWAGREILSPLGQRDRCAQVRGCGGEPYREVNGGALSSRRGPRLRGITAAGTCRNTTLAS
jgi:hypothetical protein